jgi:hypothetical protein
MERRDGDVTPKRQGGDRHSHRIEAHAELILSAVAAKSDITLSELQDGLRERGVTTIPTASSFGISTTSSPPTTSPEGSRP